jgi:hypothetical protein
MTNKVVTHEEFAKRFGFNERELARGGSGNAHHSIRFTVAMLAKHLPDKALVGLSDKDIVVKTAERPILDLLTRLPEVVVAKLIVGLALLAQEKDGSVVVAQRHQTLHVIRDEEAEEVILYLK